MEIRQFRYSVDNFGYLLFGSTQALAIDGGAVGRIMDFLGEKGLVLKFVTNTHCHPDHTAGNRELLDRTGADYLDHRKLQDKAGFTLENEKIEVIHTPGHTDDSIVFYTGRALITGDTLFNGTVGNCFSGDLKGFYRSVKALVRFPGDTVVYAGHDYVKASMAFARSVESGNADIDGYLERHDPYHVRSTLADELKVNPYLRFNEASIIDILKKKGLAVNTEYERWRGLMTLE